MKRFAICMLLCLIPAIAFCQQYKLENGGTVLLSSIISDHVNVRSVPSLKGKIVKQLDSGDRIAIAGISDQPESINAHNAYWFRIRLFQNKDRLGDELGWVFGEFVNKTRTIRPSKFTPKHFIPANPNLAAGLTFAIDRHGTITDATVAVAHFGNEPFYTFTWSDERSQFRYSDVPGSYVWYPKTNRIVHVTYLGNSLESGWVGFTDDFQYMFEDFGTAPGLRGLTIWYLPTGGVIFSGNHGGFLQLSGHTLTVAVVTGVNSYEYTSLNHAVKTRIKEYILQHPAPVGPDGGHVDSLVVYMRLDVATGFQRLINCRYEAID